MAVQKIKMPKVEKERWRELYSLAERIDRLDPWQWMDIADCFGIVLPEMPEPCFVIFSGESRKLRSLRMLLGWKALYDFMTKISNQAAQAEPWLLEIRMIELIFANQELIFRHEADFLKSMRIKADNDFRTPVFRSIIPGYQPWLPDQDECGLVSTALYQAFGMAMRVENEPALLKEHFPAKILIRKQDSKGGWQDGWMPVKELADEEVEVRIEASRLEALKKKPVVKAALQLDLAFMPMTIQAGQHRPQTAYLLLAVDAENGMILSGEVMQATDGIANMWGQVPDRLVEVFQKIGGCPAVIEVKSDRMANLLRPLEEFLPFKMVRREKLDMLAKAYDSLGEYITHGEQQD
ncbi:MAG: hypothetical protein PHU80_02650 [Kiritimatiellae bacterium]|nr:hypothetical protein [Kiritimatiellia bacterium]